MPRCRRCHLATSSSLASTMQVVRSPKRICLHTPTPGAAHKLVLQYCNDGRGPHMTYATLPQDSTHRPNTKCPPGDPTKVVDACSTPLPGNATTWANLEASRAVVPLRANQHPACQHVQARDRHTCTRARHTTAFGTPDTSWHLTTHAFCTDLAQSWPITQAPQQ